MSARTLLVPALATAVLAACAGRPEPPCTAGRLWQALSAGEPAPCEAAGDEMRSAAFLGAEYAALAGRLAALSAREEALTGSERLERVELLRELEQLAGIARVRGWAPAQGRQKQ